MDDDELEQHDIELFRKEIGDIETLKHDKIKPSRNTVNTSEIKLNRRDKLSDDLTPAYEPLTNIGSEESLSFRRSGIQERLLSRLRNGHFSMEAELDLHGMTIPLAQQALTTFIADCQHYHIRYARVIHGKGWGSKDHKPVIKTWLNGWLREMEEVLAFCSARIEDGGTGALYVLLRRDKKQQ